VRLPVLTLAGSERVGLFLLRCDGCEARALHLVLPGGRGRPLPPRWSSTPLPGTAGAPPAALVECPRCSTLWDREGCLLAVRLAAARRRGAGPRPGVNP
jgi:hypothetical protein